MIIAMNVCVKLLQGDLLTVAVPPDKGVLPTLRRAVAQELGCPPEYITTVYDAESDCYVAVRVGPDVRVWIRPRDPPSCDRFQRYMINIRPYDEFLYGIYDKEKGSCTVQRQADHFTQDLSWSCPWFASWSDAFWALEHTGKLRYPQALSEYADGMDHRMLRRRMTIEMYAKYQRAAYRYESDGEDDDTEDLPPVFFCPTVMHERLRYL